MRSVHACDMGKSQTHAPYADDGQLAQNPKELVKLKSNSLQKFDSKNKGFEFLCVFGRSCCRHRMNYQLPRA